MRLCSQLGCNPGTVRPAVRESGAVCSSSDRVLPRPCQPPIGPRSDCRARVLTLTSACSHYGAPACASVPGLGDTAAGAFDAAAGGHAGVTGGKPGPGRASTVDTPCIGHARFLAVLQCCEWGLARLTGLSYGIAGGKMAPAARLTTESSPAAGCHPGSRSWAQVASEEQGTVGTSAEPSSVGRRARRGGGTRWRLVSVWAAAGGKGATRAPGRLGQREGNVAPGTARRAARDSDGLMRR